MPMPGVEPGTLAAASQMCQFTTGAMSDRPATLPGPEPGPAESRSIDSYLSMCPARRASNADQRREVKAQEN